MHVCVWILKPNPESPSSVSQRVSQKNRQSMPMLTKDTHKRREKNRIRKGEDNAKVTRQRGNKSSCANSPTHECAHTLTLLCPHTSKYWKKHTDTQMKTDVRWEDRPCPSIEDRKHPWPELPLRIPTHEISQVGLVSKSVDMHLGHASQPLDAPSWCILSNLCLRACTLQIPT